MKKYGIPALILVLIAAGALAGLSSLMRPRVLPASGPEAAFSAERAMAHVSALSQAPHPPGSAEIERVRATILAELEAMGLEPEVQASSIAVPWGSAAIGSTIQNIVAVLPGTDPTRALLLDAHDDTRAMMLWRAPAKGRAEIVWTLGALPGIVLLIPGLYVMYHFALAPMIGILAFMVALLLGLLIPQLDRLTRSHPWRLTGAAAAICVALLVAGSLSAGFSPDRPRPNAVAYLLDADAGEATWFSAGGQQDDWTRQFFETAPEHGSAGKLFPIAQRSGFPVMRGDAPAIALEAPQIELLDDRTSGGVRTLRPSARSPRGAPVLMLDVEPYAAVRAATVEGARIETVASTRSLWSLTYYALPAEGIEVVLELDPAQAITLQASDQTWELVPEVLESAGAGIQPRTDAMMPMPNFDYGAVVVRAVRVD